MFRNIAVIVCKNPRLLKLAELTARTFPSATYHLISSIRTYESRPIPSTIINDVLYGISDDALSGIKMAIERFDVLSIKEVRLHGNPEKMFTEYIINKRIDLMVHAIMPGEKPGKALPINLKKILGGSKTSFFLHTSCMDRVPEYIEKVLLITGESPHNIVRKVNEVLNYLRRKGLLKEIALLCGERELCNLVLNESGVKALNIPLKIVFESSKNMANALRSLSEEADLVIGCRDILKECQFSSTTRITTGNLLRYSEAPLLLL